MPSQSPESPHSLLLTHLSTKTTTLEDLHQTLLSSLQRAGWTERVRALAIELLRAGRAETFEEAFEEVVGLVVGGGGGSKDANTNGDASVNTSVNGNGVEGEDRDAEGEEEEEGEGQGFINGNGTSGSNGVGNGNIEDIDVRIPEAVVGEGMRFLQEALDGVLSTDGEGDEKEEGDGGEEEGEGEEEAVASVEEKKPPVEKPSNANGNGKRGRENGDGEKAVAPKKAKGVGTKGGKGGK